MVWHIIEGAAGCAYAVEHRCVAIIVDALRASATAAMLFHAGARRLLVVQELAQAFAARATMPDMLLFGALAFGAKESSELKTPAALLAWGFVGIPLAWGVIETINNAMKLFQ